MAQLLAERSPADLIQAELVRVEQVLEQVSVSEVEALQEAARHILCAGGKRVRPQLVLLSTLATGGSLERAIPLAAACELVHTATLVHDDIVDDSQSRRGRMSVQFYFGNSASVLMGDYLVVRAFRLIAADPERQLWTILSDTIARMCEGEVLQLCVRGDTDVRLEVYETIIQCKTALLIAACTRFGALASEAPGEWVEALAEFGSQIGMAFQIQDDILDFTGNERTLGKPVGGDLREGKVTLPVIYALGAASPEQRELLLRCYGRSGALSPEAISQATGVIEELGGFDRARRQAFAFVERAQQSLDRLPPSEAREALRRIATRFVDRYH